jgi:hypothetical protein
LPNDEQEVQRLNELQSILRSFLGSKILAPISHEAPKIMDIGTRSGILISLIWLILLDRWTLEVAKQFPTGEIIGLDFSPFRPIGEVPENCTFKVGDLMDSLDDYHEGFFDLIHSRYAYLPE